MESIFEENHYYAQNGVNWSFLAQFSGTFWNFYLNLCTEFCRSFTLLQALDNG